MVDSTKTNAAAPSAPSPNQRRKVCKRHYTMPDGTEQRSAAADAVALVFDFDGDETGAHEVTVDQFSPAVQKCAAWHGLSQVLGDAFAGAKSAEAAEEQFLDKLGTLLEGVWVAERKGTRKPSIPPVEAIPTDLVVQAIVAALNANGEAVDAERQASIAAKVKGKEAKEKALLNDAIRTAFIPLWREYDAQRAKAKPTEATNLQDF